MEPLVATVPRESLEISEQILISESNPENSAWIEYKQKCFAVGFLARKPFNADLLQKRKFELAQRALALAIALAIATYGGRLHHRTKL